MAKDTIPYISIHNARANNLKGIDLDIPKNKLIVITGLSGSGKSSLAFDTLYAEGQRRYVESMSSYARQFMGRLRKPEVDMISGLTPTIAIEQRVISHNPRSTVGTVTEIYDYLKLLFARIGKTFSPVSGKLVKRHQVMDVVNYINSLPLGTEIYILAPVSIPKERSIDEQLFTLMQQGYSRVLIDGEITRIDDFIEKKGKSKRKPSLMIVVDRLKRTEHSEDAIGRLSDSVQTAFYEGKDTCKILSISNEERTEMEFSTRFEADGITFDIPSPVMFAFNSPYGACPRCNGFGNVIGIDPALVVPNQSLSVFDGAIACWKGEKMSLWKDRLVNSAHRFNFPIHKPYFELSEEQKKLLWTGNSYFGGINEFFDYVESQAYKIQYRVLLSRYRGKTTCPECKGLRLKKEASYVKVGGRSISELVNMPIDELKTFFDNLKLDEHDSAISERLLVEIKSRLSFLLNVGLGYLTLNRSSNTLSGGESQRINLATSLGSSLVGATYILDEPSIGLHQRDTKQLIKVLQRLRDIGNTVIVVEHDEEIIRAADHIIDIGPLAGRLGGELVFQGDIKALAKAKDSLTADYIYGKASIAPPKKTRSWNNAITIHNATENNLKNITVTFPLNTFTVVTGVSGSGKSTLVRDILYPAIKRQLNETADYCGSFGSIDGNISAIEAIELVDQNPIGKSSRSNPITYIKAYDDIRQLFAEQKLAKMRGITAAHFSFNTPGGRCDDCDGEGTTRIEMQFMADIYLPCDVCHGKRFKDEILDITFNGKNVSDILDMTINEAVEFFSQEKNNLTEKILSKLKPLQDVGLGYVKMGQPSNTLSGGESQRIKLASFLVKGQNQKRTLFIFDEPTTGLHFDDVRKLLDSLEALVNRGHSVIAIEHNLDVIRSADHIIDLGPEGGQHGGEVVFTGTPEQLMKNTKSYTGKALAEQKK